MNKTLQQKLDSLESLIGTQKDSVVGGGRDVDYMHGMANGMILAHAIFADLHNPKFVTRPRKPYGRIVRHKSVKSKRNR
jgi:hypothetical protein